ncbi:MAG: cytochrome c biogenesis protein CcsA [Gammaproteobacteria bacterium]|jgi:ABC-type uncharacterized transport system permease subunit
MTDLLAAFLAITLYLGCTVLLLMRLKKSRSVAALSKRVILFPGFLGLGAHLYTLSQSMINPDGINIGFFTALSLVGAFITLFTLVSALRHPIEIVGIIVLPIAAITLAADHTTATIHLLPPGSATGLIIHVVTSIIAYSILGLAAIQAVVLSVQNSLLHKHQPGGLIRMMPPLKTMESLLFDAIIIGFVCLSVSLVSGMVFLEDMFAQHLAHKTVLSIIAWLVFATLLAGRWLVGWRGRTAIRWTLGGFISLMLAYFGSKFVLEVILASS